MDGVLGVRTREAIRRYQGKKEFEATGYLRAQESEVLVAVGEEAAARAQAKVEAERREAKRKEEAARRADDEAYAAAKSLDTVEAYGSYLSNYPKGRHATDIR